MITDFDTKHLNILSILTAKAFKLSKLKRNNHFHFTINEDEMKFGWIEKQFEFLVEVLPSISKANMFLFEVTCEHPDTDVGTTDSVLVNNTISASKFEATYKELLSGVRLETKQGVRHELANQ